MMLRLFDISTLNKNELADLCRRPKIDFKDIFGTVQSIIQNVEEHGDTAVAAYTEQFDKVRPAKLMEPIADLAAPELDAELEKAIDLAIENVRKFHLAQAKDDLRVETMPGIVCEKRWLPIKSVGIYVPGGSAILPSTAIMLSVPAKLAGCETIVLACPPNKDGEIADEVAYVAKKTGVTHILKAGGAQAVAAMAVGTETVPKVDKILGPGNQYVTAAKMLLQNSEHQISIDMPAGPSEVLVIADGESDLEFVAADLLSQAEHGPDSQVVLVCERGLSIEELNQQLEMQISELPREPIARQALKNSFILLVDNLEQAIDFSNSYAPEHLIIQTEDARNLSSKVTNAGSVFLGKWSPESVGDYASGTNHTLPTYGFAKQYSGVSLDSFQKSITFQELSKEGLINIGPAVEKIALAENLDAHKQAVSRRLSRINS